MKSDLARNAFAKEMAGGSPAEEEGPDLEKSGEAIMGKAIRMALESKDDAALCRAVKDAVGGGGYEEESSPLEGLD